MSQGLKFRSLAPWLRSSAAIAAMLWTAPAIAQDAGGPSAASSDIPDNAVVTVKMLIEEGIITPEQGQRLARRAAQARAQQTAAAPVAAGAVGTDLAPPPAGAIRVPYVPASVRAQIAQEVRGQVMAQAKAEGWAAPDTAAPDWVRNIAFHGDLRVRSASALYSKDNTVGAYFDVPAFNASGPYDLSGAGRQLLPSLNTTRDKFNNVQLRARLGVEATIAGKVQLGIQLATGDDAGPISTNATLTGGFRKRDVWIQNAYARGEIVPGLLAMIGRFDNPFRTTDLMFDPDLALDGLYADTDVTKVLGEKSVSLHLRGGAFPIQFEPNNFPETSIAKRDWRDRYLISGQIEVAKTFGGGIEADLSGAYHDFTYLRGHVSAPCDVYSTDNIECSTDLLRPLWATKGNTLMLLRRIDENANTDPANPRNPQYLGLKFAYRVLDANASISVPVSDRIRAKLTGSYLYNFGFDPRNICREGPTGAPINNVIVTDPKNTQQGACDANPARFVGGNQGYGGYFSIGDPALFSVNPRRARSGSWAVNLAYKYLESDVIPDSFADSDFHLGGTNAKGYVIGATWAPLDGMTIGGRWLSADNIVDAPLKIDVLQVDLGFAF